MSTLYDLISPHGLSSSACRAHYGPFLALASRLVGVPLTDFASIAHLSPSTVGLYTGIFRPCFRVPECDFRKTALSPHQRRLVLLESSVAHGCAFCTAHTANMGDALNGPLITQCARAGRVVGAAKEDGDDEIMALIGEVCGFPGTVTEDTRKKFEEKFGTAGYREVAGMTAFMAWLNFIMDVLGIPLENGLAPFAKLVLGSRQLPFDVMDNVGGDGNDSFGEERVRIVTSGKGAKPFRRFAAQLRNIAALFGLAPHVARALSIERQLLKDIPKSVNQIEQWRERQFGCMLKFDQDMTDAEIKRALTYAVHEVFFRDEVSKWTRFEKFALLYVFGKGQVSNSIIAGDAVSLAAAQSVKASTSGKEVSSEALVAEVQEKLEKVSTAASSSLKPTNAFSAAAKFMYSAAGPGGSVQKAGTGEVLLTFVESPESVMDIMGLLGMCGLMHRMAVMCGGK